MTIEPIKNSNQTCCVIANNVDCLNRAIVILNGRMPLCDTHHDRYFGTKTR